jgi:alpha-1,2-mannosyltransferase
MATASTLELRSPTVSSTSRRDLPVRPRSTGRWLLDHAWWVVPALAFGFVTHQLWNQTYWQRLDFHIYMEAVDSWSRTSSIYAYAEAGTHLGFTYPPFAAVVLWPLAHLDRAFAEHVWMMASLLASLAFLVVVGRALPDPPRWRCFVPLFVAAGLLTTPVVLTTRLGQVNAFLALLVLVDCLSARRDRRFTGVGVGLAAAIKLTPMVGVLYFAVARRGRAIVTTAITFAGATLVAWALHPSDSNSYWTDVLFDTSRVGQLGSPLSNSLRRVVTWLNAGNGVESILWVGLCLAIVAVGVWRARIAWDRRNDLAAITLVMCVGLLCAPITWSHHLYFLIPAIPLLVGNGRSVLRWVAVALTLPIMFELQDQGQDATQSGWRVLFLLLVIVALPLDRRSDLAPASAGGSAEPLAPTPPSSPSPAPS